MNHRLFVAYWNPNGTNDLYILSKDGAIELLSEALYGVSVGVDVDREVLCIGHDGLELIDGETFETHPEYYSPVRELSLAEALSAISCNPVTDGSETAKKICSFFMGGDRE